MHTHAGERPQTEHPSCLGGWLQQSRNSYRFIHTHSHSKTLMQWNLLCLTRQSPDATGDRTQLSKDWSQIQIPSKSHLRRTIVHSLSAQITFNFLYKRSLTAQSSDCSMCLGCLIQNLPRLFTRRSHHLPSAQKSFLSLETFRGKAKDSCTSLSPA